MPDDNMSEITRKDKLVELLAILEPLSDADRYCLLKSAWIFYGLVGLKAGE